MIVSGAGVYCYNPPPTQPPSTHHPPTIHHPPSTTPQDFSAMLRRMDQTTNSHEFVETVYRHSQLISYGVAALGLGTLCSNPTAQPPTAHHPLPATHRPPSTTPHHPPPTVHHSPPPTAHRRPSPPTTAHNRPAGTGVILLTAFMPLIWHPYYTEHEDLWPRMWSSLMG